MAFKDDSWTQAEIEAWRLYRSHELVDLISHSSRPYIELESIFLCKEHQPLPTGEPYQLIFNPAHELTLVQALKTGQLEASGLYTEKNKRITLSAAHWGEITSPRYGHACDIKGLTHYTELSFNRNQAKQIWKETPGTNMKFGRTANATKKELIISEMAETLLEKSPERYSSHGGGKLLKEDVKSRLKQLKTASSTFDRYVGAVYSKWRKEQKAAAID